MKNKILFGLACLFLGLEVYLSTNTDRPVNIYWTPFQLIGVQLIMAFLFLNMDIKKNENQAVFSPKALWQRIALWTLFSVGVFATYKWVEKIYKSVPIDVKMSDIIPQATLLAKRFLAGTFPYEVIPVSEFGYEMLPTYLPAQWMPYCIAQIFNFDARWVSWGVFIIALFALIYYINKRQKNILLPISVILLLFSAFCGIKENAGFNLAATVELLTAGYYLLLTVAILSKSNTLRVIAISLCLMSRFSFVFWLPLYFFILWHTEGKKQTIKLGAIIALVCTVWYGSFMLKDPFIFLNAQKSYLLATVGEWQRTDFNHLMKGMGLAQWFREAHSDNAEWGIKKIQKVMFLASVLTSLLMGLCFYYIIKLKQNNVIFNNDIKIRHYSLFALKISLTVFYAFVQIPYAYLNFVPLMISFAIIAEMSLWLDKQEVIN